MDRTIFPCLWFDNDAEKAANFYVEIFDGAVLENTLAVINIKIFGQRVMLLQAGPQFKKNPAVSFTILCNDKNEAQRLWDALAKNGKILMGLSEYPWSSKFGWVEDQFGVSWQVFFSDKEFDQKLVPTLMFMNKNKDKGTEAMQLYTSVFSNSQIGSISECDEDSSMSERPGSVRYSNFSINDYQLVAIDITSEHRFDFNEGISMVVLTDSQQETDHYWEALTANGGRESMCGWLKDPFGLSWQIVPKKLLTLMNGEDRMKGVKVMQAMLKMKKIVIKDLQEAYDS